MTDEHKLFVTYLSLLILQDRLQFALRAINLIHSQVKTKLVCHANLTKLYGLCLLKSSKDRIKDAFELFRRAKKLFKLIGGDSKKANLGVAQCYLIQATLLRTKSDQIFTHKQAPEQVVLKKAQKRYEAAKKIYRERDHMAGQLFCC